MNFSGTNGIDGEDPPIPETSTVATSIWDSLGFDYNITMNQNQTDEESGLVHNYIGMSVFGRNATLPGNGGHGGVGGIGGHAGTHFIVGLEKHQDFSIFDSPGNFIYY